MKEKFNLKSYIRNQFPEFVREDHSKFIDFIEAFYEWLDNNPNFLRNTSQLENITDIDETLDLFIEDFKNTYMKSFPIDLVINPTTGQKLDPRKIIKNIKNFYKAKGIENSYRFIFRVLYNSEIEIYNPKDFVMNLSDGKWIENNKIYISPTRTAISNISGRNICQRTIPLDPSSEITARARVTESFLLLRNTNYVLELTLEEVFGNFSVDYPILDLDSGVNYGNTYSVLNDIIIENQGYGYSVGQKVVFEELSDSFLGYLPKAKIEQVSSGSGLDAGKVLKVKIEDPGLLVDSTNCGISGNNPIDIKGQTGSDFSASLNFGALFDKNKYYLDNTGKLSSSMVLQDNYKYQEYSYVIKSSLSLRKYVDVVKGILHPAGVQLLGEILIKRCLRGDLYSILNMPKRNIKMIGNYFPYTFSTYDNIGSWMNGNCYDPDTHDPLVSNSLSGNPISDGQDFVPVNEADCTTADIPDDYPYNFWDTLPHPNIYMTRGVVGTIYTNQLDDFYGPTNTGSGQSEDGWQEWNYSDTNGGTVEQQENWLQDILNSDNGTNIAGLNVNLGTEFRKIPIYAFLEVSECTYDCRYTNGCVEPELNNNDSPTPPISSPESGGGPVVGPGQDVTENDSVLV